VFFRLAVKGYSGIKRHAVHPCAEFGFAPEFWISLPELYGDLLKQIVMSLPVISI